MSSTCDIKKQCSFLKFDEEQACSLTKGGIFIPLPEHIEMFCKTTHYIECEQYSRGNGLYTESANEELFINNGRRLFRRIPDILALTLANCDDAGHPSQIIDAHACTLDLSLGGMLLESRHALQKNNLVAFTFGPHFSTPNHTGIGQVRWCQEVNEPDVFHTGLSFIDASTKQALGHHMGIPV